MGFYLSFPDKQKLPSARLPPLHGFLKIYVLPNLAHGFWRFSPVPRHTDRMGPWFRDVEHDSGTFWRVCTSSLITIPTDGHRRFNPDMNVLKAVDVNATVFL